ncbi:hypothetical protein [Arthrobacter sp. NyZ413]|uniref:hypothetical protein n=1 Tax=Arthrobacter sp. NyZ413 TaxID=3144669 RepID=UPI003BF8DEE7
MLDDAVFSSAIPVEELDDDSELEAVGLDIEALGVEVLDELLELPELPPHAESETARARTPRPVMSCFFMVCSFAGPAVGRAGC